jgi:UMF1 family MFS transporter
VPTVLYLKDKRLVSQRKTSIMAAAKLALSDATSTLRQIRRYATLAIFLVAFLFFNDGVQTVISQSSTFALQELEFSESELVGVILMIQFLAVPGALALGWLADRWGQKLTLILCLVIWVGLLTSAWFVSSKGAFWLMAAGVALVLGGTQAIARAIMGVLTPERHAAQFFGFFNLSGKATSFMGTFAFGMVIAWTGSSRLAIVNLLVFFLIGLMLVARVDMKRGAAERSGDSMNN